MNVIVHFPESDTAKEELAKRVAEIHAHTVVEYINALHLPEKKAKELCTQIINGTSPETEF